VIHDYPLDLVSFIQMKVHMDRKSCSIKNIADTARWMAFYRAMESERPDALFHDPYARLLAGERGKEMPGP
jgi:O-methyltransferase involved in polyketide biosynthesis